MVVPVMVVMVVIAQAEENTSKAIVQTTESVLTE